MVDIDFLTSVNTAAGVLSPDTLNLYLDYLRDQLRQRTRLLSNNGFGIIDNADPRYNATNNTTKPLWVTFGSNDYTQVLVYPGTAVTPLGDIIELNAQTSVVVPGVYRGDVSIILAVYSDVPSGVNALTIDGQITDVGTIGQTQIIAVMQSTFQAYAQSDLQNMVVLGTVLWSDSQAPVLFTDYSNGYTWNRPWYSAYDVTHRNQIGTGTVTSTNPHGTSLNDLAIGPLTIYTQLTSTGMILSKDTSTPGIPGYLCLDEILPGSIQVDSDSSVTSSSWFSRPGVYYVVLSAIPNCLHGARLKSTPTTEVAIDWIVGTPYVLLISQTLPTDTVQFYYSKSDAGSIATSTSTSVTFTQANANELVIVGGLAKTALLRLTASVRKYGQVPRELAFLVGSFGQIYLDPAVIVAFTEVSLSANTAIPGDVSLPSPGKLGVAIANMQTLSTTGVYFQIIGTDVNGNTISEILSFDATSWEMPIIPSSYEDPLQVHYTQNTFYSFVSVTPLNSTAYPMTDIGSPTFAVFLQQDYSLSQTTRLATAFWDGSEMQNLKDGRRVLPVVRDGWYGYTSLNQAAESIVGIDDVLGTGNNSQLIVAEDFQQPTVLSAYTVQWDGGGLLSVPVLDPHLSNTDNILRCYRSRTIPLKISPSDLVNIVVLLFGGDPAVNEEGTVRIVYRTNGGARAEAVLVPFATDGSGSLFVGFVQAHWDSVAFVISGKCHGFAAYIVRPTVIQSQYIVVPV